MTSTAQSAAARPPPPPRPAHQTHETTADMMIQKMSVLAQAKPAIINSSSNQYSNGSPDPDELVASSELSDNLNAALKLSRASQSELQLRTQAEFLMRRSESASLSQHQHQERLRAMHIDDSTTIEKQNATNQMRQAAVMSALAAAASQQQSKQQRLSATERLAMTARRPQAQTQTQQPAHQRSNSHLKQDDLPPPPAVPTHQHHSRSISQPATAQVRPLNKPALDSKPVAAMPTLETLLAVQRQLQRHTRQNLTHNSTNQPQDLVNKQQQVVTTTTTTNKTNEREQYFSKQYPNLTSRLQPPVIEREQNNYVTASHLRQHETYDKELPPLPASISPSSTYTTNTTDGESQMNSLESQSSPATSLISLPPPPPPLSSYLQQYDEVTSSQNHRPPTQQQPSGNGSLQSNVSTPQTSCDSPSSAGSYHEVSPLRHSPVVPIKQQQQQVSSTTSAPPARQAAPPPLAPRPAHLNLNLQPSKSHPSQNPPQPEQQVVAPDQLPSGFQTSPNNRASLPPPPPLPAEPQPPAGLDQPDCASFRFPTPPPPEMLLDDMDDDDLEMMLVKKSVQFGNGGGDDDDDDEDFQCRIPTPPSNSGQKSMSFVSFQDLNNHCHRRPDGNSNMQHEQRMSHFFASSAATTPDQQQQQQQQQEQQHRVLFNSSSFSVPQQQQQTTTSGEQQITAMQPPPLFRQAQVPQQQPTLAQHRQQPVDSHQQQNQQVKTTTSNGDIKIPAPQLTVRVNEQEEAAARLASANSSGLLSTASGHNQHLQHHHLNHANMHQQHHSFMMNTMVRGAVVSSSSPSSSSDGDGHSSNSSSSTSGVHSSIDSPSLKSETDFNYGNPAVAASINLMRAPATTDIRLMKKPPAAAPPPRHQHKFLPQPHQQQQQQYVNTRELHRATTRSSSVGQQRRNSSSSINSTSTITSGTGSVTGNQQQQHRQQQQPNKMPRPALKQKKSVSFSDRIELVACAEEQCEQHLPNPLLARVLAATKSQ